MMDTRSRLLLAAGAATCLALVVMDRVVGKKKKLLIVEQDMPVPAEAVIEAVKQVENEAQLVPRVSAVDVNQRNDEQVIYTLHGGCCCASVRNRKWWDESIPAVYWETLNAPAGFHEEGSIHFAEKDGSSSVYLTSWHWVTTPIIGRITTLLISPILKGEFRAWLKNLSDSLTKRSD